MDETLEKYAGRVKDQEFEELFPETSTEEAKQDEEKVKEALFQVHHMVYNKKLYQKVQKSDDYWIPLQTVKEMLDGEKEFVRFKKATRGATLKKEDGETQIPRTDLRDVLKPRKGLMD